MSDHQIRLPFDRLAPDDYAELRRRQLEIVGETDPDLREAARRCYTAWLEALGPVEAEKRVQKHYPDRASAIIAEARHMLEDAS